MARNYLYEWLPAVLVGTLLILALPWLAVIALLALLIAVVGGLGLLAMGLVAAGKGLGRTTVGHSRHQSEVSQRVALQGGGVGSATTAPQDSPRISDWLLHFPHPRPSPRDAQQRLLHEVLSFSQVPHDQITRAQQTVRAAIHEALKLNPHLA